MDTLMAESEAIGSEITFARRPNEGCPKTITYTFLEKKTWRVYYLKRRLYIETRDGASLIIFTHVLQI